MEAILFLTWFALSFGVGYVAQERGHSAAAFFLLSIVLSPVVGIIAACAMPSPKG